MKDRTEKQRSSNIELLRIVAIIFVITLSQHSFITTATAAGTLRMWMI